MSDLAFPAFLEAIRLGNAAEVQAGYLRIAREFRRLHHPIFVQACEDQSGDALSQLVQEFVVYLTTSEEGKKSAAQLNTWRGVRLEALRRARRGQRRAQSIEDKNGIFRELLYTKVRAILREPIFERVGRCYRLAALPDGVTGWPAAQDDDAIQDQLPPIKAMLDNPREDQSPQVASRGDILTQLERILTLGGNEPRLLVGLVDLVWGSLVPIPGSFQLRPEELPHPSRTTGQSSAGSGGGPPEPGRIFVLDQCPSPTPSPSQQVDDASWQARADQEARAFLSSLEERLLKSVRLYRGLSGGQQRTLEQVGQLLGVSKSTVENDQNAFREKFERWVQRQHLDPQQREDLKKRILEALREEDPRQIAGARQP